MSSTQGGEWKRFLTLTAGFLVLYYLPVQTSRFQAALLEAFKLAKWYAREHVLLCLVPAFFIAGAIGVFMSQNVVMKYLGPHAPKWLSYPVASVAGTILAVCSCTVLPLFGGIYMRGAGLGPAIAFLYSGPAINVLAIVLTARILGWRLGLARAVGAIGLSVVIGLLMHVLFMREEKQRVRAAELALDADSEQQPRALWKTSFLLISMIGVLVFANWARSGDVRAVFLCCPGGLTVYRAEGQTIGQTGETLRIMTANGEVREVHLATLRSIEPLRPRSAVNIIYRVRWVLVAGCLLVLSVMVAFWMGGTERREWLFTSWAFAKQILPLLFAGVLAAGFFLGSPEGRDTGIIPNRWIQALVGDSPSAIVSLISGEGGGGPEWVKKIWPLWTNLFASVTGALMYFATLTEVPILRGLLDSGMGQGPALALLLAGPALSLPNMLVINSILGPKKTLTYIGLVVIMATVTGMSFGAIVR